MFDNRYGSPVYFIAFAMIITHTYCCKVFAILYGIVDYSKINIFIYLKIRRELLNTIFYIIY